jgi:hypothetical protein
MSEDQLPDATKMIGPDHSVAPNDMTSELAEVASELVALWELEGGHLLKSDSPSIIPARAVLDKWHATRKEQV